MGTPLTDAHRSWRVKVFVATWLSYVGFYFCRTPFAATKSEIGKEAQWGATELGDIEAAYLIAYAVGQFLASGMGTKLGPRRNVLLGMALSITVTSLMGITLTVPIVMGLVAVNGLAQATGWSGNVGTMASWFHKHERGRIMGMWSTNFTVGSLASQYAMAGMLAIAVAYGGSWRWCFYLGACVLAAVWLQFFLFQRNRPEDVGLLPVDDPVTPADEAKEPEPVVIGFMGLTRIAWTNLLLVGGFYFFSKLIRYAIWSWAAYFLVEYYKMSPSGSNVYATVFGVCGLPGVFLTGWVSDRYFKSRRAGVALIMMLGMTLATGLLMAFGDTGVVAFTVLLGAVGFTLFGPDALLSGAAAMDIGGRRAATFATALIGGLGALGPVVQSLVIGRLYDSKGGDLTPVFLLLFGSAAMATMFCGLLVLRNRRNGNGV
ncbi:MAG: MFS transporter [Deltaproteobacteria bacterium]|nr:MFS transporter [Deltaproteobacteria bacterium]MDQ3299205.1 MFS transporter [Myxococcota bacterium]